MPPLWQYLSPLSYADESIPAPKGDGLRTPVAFSLQTSRFQGTAGRSHDRHRGPGQATPCRWAKAIPRCGSTSRVCERAWTPDPCGFFPANWQVSGNHQGDHDRPLWTPLSAGPALCSGRRPCPRSGSTRHVCQGRRAHLRPQRAPSPDHQSIFFLQMRTF
jgi:hypothetical protein